MVETGCFERAETQFGIVSREFASALSDRQVAYRVKTGRWHRVMPGVFRLAGAPATWEGALLAAELWATEGVAAKKQRHVTVVSHRSAARLHGFSAFASTTALELSSTRDLRSTRVKVHRLSSHDHHDRVVRGSFFVTSVARTLVDLAGVVDEVVLAACLDEALSHKKATLEDVERAVQRAKRSRGLPVLRALVESRAGKGGPTESELERVGLRVMEEGGVPRPTIQKRITTRRGRPRVDCVFEAQRVIVELDGYAFHSDVRAFEADRQRTNALLARGFVVLRWTWTALHERPEELVLELVSVLGARSH